MSNTMKPNDDFKLDFSYNDLWSQKHCEGNVTPKIYTNYYQQVIYLD